MSATRAVSQHHKPFLAGDTARNSIEWCPLAGGASSHNYSVSVAKTIQEIEALRPVWKKWMHTLDSDIDFYLHNLSHDGSVVRPYVLTVCSGGIARAMLIGCIRARKTSATVSFVTVPGPAACVLEIKHGGRIGQPSAEIDKLLARELLNVAKSGGVDSICFERLPMHSGIFREIKGMSGFLIKQRVPHHFCYSILMLKEQQTQRHGVFTRRIGRELRRKERILAREFPGRVSLKCFSKPAELDAGLCDAMRVAVTTWQYYLGLGLVDNAYTRATFGFLADRGWLRIYVLYVGDRPCAFLVGQRYNNSFYCQYAGYHPNYARFSVGSLLTGRAFEDLATAGVQRVDLGEGGQEHNRRLGCQICAEGTVHVYSPTFRGICLNLFVGATQLVRRAGRHAQSALRLNQAQNIWSQFLLSRWKSRAFLSPQAYRQAIPENVQRKR
jgi:hypothetical protein